MNTETTVRLEGGTSAMKPGQHEIIPLPLVLLGSLADMLDRLMGRHSLDFKETYTTWLRVVDRNAAVNEATADEDAGTSTFRMLCSGFLVIGTLVGLLALVVMPADSLWAQVAMLIITSVATWAVLTSLLGTLSNYGAHLLFFRFRNQFQALWWITFTVGTGAIYVVFAFT